MRRAENHVKTNTAFSKILADSDTKAPFNLVDSLQKSRP